MASSKSSVILILFEIIFITEFQKGDALKCIQCNSLENANCTSNPKEIQATECTVTNLFEELSNLIPRTSSNTITNQTSTGREFLNQNFVRSKRQTVFDIFADPNWRCFKVIAKDQTGKEVVVRGCAPISTTCDSIPTEIVWSVCEVCKDDGCNLSVAHNSDKNSCNNTDNNFSNNSESSLTTIFLLLGITFYLRR